MADVDYQLQRLRRALVYERGRPFAAGRVSPCPTAKSNREEQLLYKKVKLKQKMIRIQGGDGHWIANEDKNWIIIIEMAALTNDGFVVDDGNEDDDARRWQ